MARPRLDVEDDLSVTGSADGNYIDFRIVNTSDEEAVDVEVYLIADDAPAEINSRLSRLAPKTSSPLQFQYGETLFFRKPLTNPRLEFKYRSPSGRAYCSGRALKQIERNDGNFNIFSRLGSYYDSNDYRNQVRPAKVAKKANHPSAVTVNFNGSIVSGDSYSGNFIGNKKVGSERNTTFIAGKGMGFWATVISGALATVIGSTIMLVPNLQTIVEAPTINGQATTTLNLAEIFAKANPMSTSVEKANFINNYANLNVYGTGNFEDIVPGNPGYIVLMEIQDNEIGCEFSEIEKSRLMLLQKGDKVKFYGTFTTGGFGGFGAVNPWVISNCDLIN